MSIASQWAAFRKEKDDAAVAAVYARYGTDLQAFQRDVERQRAIARECRKRDALPYCDREEETLP